MAVRHTSARVEASLGLCSMGCGLVGVSNTAPGQNISKRTLNIYSRTLNVKLYLKQCNVVSLAVMSERQNATGEIHCVRRQTEGICCGEAPGGNGPLIELLRWLLQNKGATNGIKKRAGQALSVLL